MKTPSDWYVAGSKGKAIWFAKFSSAGKEIWHNISDFVPNEDFQRCFVSFFMPNYDVANENGSEMLIKEPFNNCLYVIAQYNKNSSSPDGYKFIYTIDINNGKTISSPTELFGLASELRQIIGHYHLYIFVSDNVGSGIFRNILCYDDKGKFCWQRAPIDSENTDFFRKYHNFYDLSDEVMLFTTYPEELNHGFRVINIKNRELIFAVDTEVKDWLLEGEYKPTNSYKLTNAKLDNNQITITYDEYRQSDEIVKDPITGYESYEVNKTGSFVKVYSFPDGEIISWSKL